MEVSGPEQVPPLCHRIGERPVSVLHVDEKGGQVVGEVVANAIGMIETTKRRSAASAGLPDHRAPARVQSAKAASRPAAAARRPKEFQATSAVRPGCSRGIEAAEIEPPEGARQPVERDRGERAYHEDESRRGQLADARSREPGSVRVRRLFAFLPVMHSGANALTMRKKHEKISAFSVQVW